MAKQSSVNLDITNNADGFDISGGTTVRKLGITGGDVTIAGSGSAVVTFPTTSTTIAGLGITQSFSALQSFSAGISAAGGATFATDISVNGIRVGKGAGNRPDNVALGSNTLTLNTTGDYNLAFGSSALASNLTGTDNVGLGYGALTLNTSSNNLGIGSSSLAANSSGTDNVGVGTASLGNNSTGSRNVAIGRSALSLNGDDNVGIGAYSLSNILTAAVRNYNTAIGSDAGRYRTGGSSLSGATGGIYIGYGAKGSANAQTNEIVIGTLAEALGSNTAVIGASTQTAATIYGVLRLPGGLSAAGGSTFSGNVAMTSTSSYTGLASFAAGISAAGSTFSGNISAPNIVNSVNGLTGSVKIPRSLSVYAPTTSDSITLFYTPVALTISRISAVLRGSSTPSVTYNLNYGTNRSSGTLVFTSGTTVTSTTTATVVTSFNNSSIPAGGFLWLTASAVSGTVDELSVSVEF